MARREAGSEGRISNSALEAYFDLLIGSVTMGQLLRTEPLPGQDALRRRAERAAAALRRLAMSF